MEKYINFTGRILLGILFLGAGLSKISGYEGTQGYMEMMGVSGQLLPFVIALEIGGAVALMAGWQTRFIAYVLAGFSIVSGIMFHADFADQMQMTMFMKNIAIAGGLLVVAAQNVKGTIGFDSRIARAKQNIAEQVNATA